MRNGLNVAALTRERRAEWDALADSSPDAWFWQTAAWIDWATAIAASAFAGAHSFLIERQGGEVIGICPVNVEEREGERTFSFLGGPLPAPAFAHDLAAAEREQALALYVTELEALAQRHRVARGSVKVPFTTTVRCVEPEPNPWLRFGYFDLPFTTRIIDLGPGEDLLWTHVRKGHRSDVKRAAALSQVAIWDRGSITREKMLQYRDLHARDAGRATRASATFDLMEGWIRSGRAILAETHRAGQPLAFAVVIYYKTGAFYASGCREPDVQDVPASHLLQWEVMRWLKNAGCEHYDIGMQYAGPQWFYVPSEKEMSIAAFKRGFGGRTVPLVTAERFYDTAALRATFERRVRQYLEATAGQSSPAVQ